jgi:hypothetical protein
MPRVTGPWQGGPTQPVSPVSILPIMGSTNPTSSTLAHTYRRFDMLRCARAARLDAGSTRRGSAWAEHGQKF